MSLFWRIFSAFTLIIIITVLVSVGIDYSSTRTNLPLFATKIHAENIAAGLSRAYTLDKSWASLDKIITQNGYLGPIDKSIGGDVNNMDLSIHLIVRDPDGRTLYNSFSKLVQASSNPLIEGGTELLFDLEENVNIGSVTTYINRSYLERESVTYLKQMLPERILQASVTILLAALLAFVLSRRIAAPIITLSRATQDIVQNGAVRELPVRSSDELGSMTEAFNQMTRHLETQRNLRRRLISDLSHELNTPLNVIKLEAHGAIDELKPSRDAFEQINVEVGKLTSLLNDLNWLAETDSGIVELEKKIYPYHQFISEEVERWQIESQALGINLKLESLPADPHSISMDVERMSQVLGNLIRNGFKYTPAGGQVTVLCRCTSGVVTTTVSDTGMGISPLDLPHIFERFYRADKSRQISTGGRGLGLSIVKQIVELHGGKVWAESEPGVGSDFHFSIPFR